MNENRLNIDNATNILVSTGRDYGRCISAFEAEFGLPVPPFNGRALLQHVGDKRYARVKGKDVPALLTAGVADIGLVGSDICEESIQVQDATSNQLLFKTIGKPMCTFELLLPEGRSAELAARLEDENAPGVVVATSFPNFLMRCIKRARCLGRNLNIAVCPFKPSGSVEVMPQLGVCEGVADLVESGATAAQNGLAREKLADVFPAVIWRNTEGLTLVEQQRSLVGVRP